MKKRIILSFLAIIIFIFPVQNGLFPNEANAIWGKIANMSSKKVAKEVIKDIAQETALSMALNEAQKIADAASWNHLVQDEFVAICLEELLPNGQCDKPVQVKKTLSETDKTNIGNTAEIELEKALNNGVKFSKWQKFLDFFIPIFSTTLVITGIEYAIDPEVKSLFDEIAINTLIALGLMKPLEPISQPMPTVVDKTTGLPITKEPNPNNATPSVEYVNEVVNATGTSGMSLNIPLVDTVILHQFDSNIDQSTYPTMTYNIKGYYQYNVNAYDFRPDNFIYKPWTSTNTVELFDKYDVSLKAQNTTSSSLSYPTAQMENSDKITAIMTRMPYYNGGYWFTDHLFFTASGRSWRISDKANGALASEYNITNISTLVYGNDSTKINGRNEGLQTGTKRTIYTNAKTIEFEPYQAKFEDMTAIDVAQTRMGDGDGKILLVPPIAIPYTKTSTGETLEPVFDPTTGQVEIKDPTGNIVPEDDITVGDPNITNDPQGNPQVTPPATSTTPSPQPIPLTPTGTIPPQTPPPPVETLPPVFPEGQSCDVGLKLPKISPLAYAVSESFPFSIPFDLYDGFQAIFSEMGNEKPEFAYKLNFMGEQEEWKISIPDYFDSWKRFTDSFLIFVFDVGIIFMIFRFMGGSK